MTNRPVIDFIRLAWALYTSSISEGRIFEINNVLHWGLYNIMKPVENEIRYKYDRNTPTQYL